MSLIGGSIPVGATFSPTGGTARTLSSLGGDRSGVKLLVEDAAAYAVRTTLNVTTTESSVNSGYPGGATPNKRRVATVVPIVLADGSYFNNQVINEMIVHPETTDAQITSLRSLGVNIYNDADFDGLWKQGSKS